MSGAAEGRALRQPPGLALLFSVELWERFSYYGMRALLVLYVIDQASGMGWSPASAAQLYGWYTGLVWFTPILGGYLADRFLGTHRAVVIGGAIIALGHGLLALEQQAAFFAGLLAIVIGTGFFKANISTMVGQLYADDDPRRDAGFTWFYMGINVGSTLGPLVCGYLAASPRFGWAYGFGAAGVGMVLGLISYVLLKRRMLGTIGAPPARAARAATAAAEGAGSGGSRRLTLRERRRVWAIGIVAAFTVVFYLAYEQAGTSLTLFAENRTDRELGGAVGGLLPEGTIPTAWFLSLQGFFVLALSPVAAWLWARMGRRQPSAPRKMGLGLLLMAGSYAALVAAVTATPDALVSPLWLVGVYALQTCGEICLYPVGLSFVARVAPDSLKSMLMGTYLLALFAANLLAGYLASALGAVERGEVFRIFGGQADFFAIFVVLAGAAGLGLLAAAPRIGRMAEGKTAGGRDGGRAERPAGWGVDEWAGEQEG